MKIKLITLVVACLLFVSCGPVEKTNVQGMEELDCTIYTYGGLGLSLTQCHMPDGYTCVFLSSSGGVDCYKPEK